MLQWPSWRSSYTWTVIPCFITPSYSLVISRATNGSMSGIDVQGWTSQTDGRGTIDIIWSCVFTIFLCAWSAECVNVSALSDSKYALLRRKFYLTILAIAGPEVTLGLAMGQWQSARASVKAFHKSGFSDWTMTQAFFADMGGFLLKTVDFEEPFPVDAAQLHYLIVHKHLEYPADYDNHFIGDKNKSDALVRFITICQTLWFTINCICRGVQKLDLTTFEVTTLAFIYCTLGTTFFWFNKPSDVGRAVILRTEKTVTQMIRADYRDVWQEYRRTPFEVINRKEWSWGKYWSHWMNILRCLGISFAPKVRPVNRMRNDNFPELSAQAMFAFFVFSTSYGAIFFISWNYYFPTKTEHVLWNASIIANLGTIMCAWVIDTVNFRVMPALRSKSAAGSLGQRTGTRSNAIRSQSSVSGLATHIADSIRNNTPDKDPAFTTPLLALIPFDITAIVYITARAFILVEDCASLRALHASAYATVDWTQIIPHI